MDRIARQQLENIVGHVSQIAVKHWLRVSELEYSAGNTDEFYQRLSKLLESGKLMIDDLQAAALEIEENGGKRVYLREFRNFEFLSDRERFRNHLNNQGLSLSDMPNRSIKTPPEPTLNYVFWSERHVRIKFSETHVNLDVDYESQQFIPRRVTKFALALMDSDSGFIQIRLDPASQVHIHKDTRTGQSDAGQYEQFYFNQFLNILGGQEFELCDLRDAAERLVNATPRVFRLPYELVRTGANSRQRYSSRTDVRDDPARQGAAAADSQNWVFENLSGYWLPEPSEGKLQRELFMELKRKPAMIRFLADCLADEVEYALSRIRAI